MIFVLQGGPGNGQEVDLPPETTHYLFGEYWYAKKSGKFRVVTEKQSTFEMIQRKDDNDSRE